MAIATFNDCKAIKSHEWKVQGSNSYAYRLMFQGFEHDVIIAAAMYDYLTATIDRLCAQYMRELALGKSLTKISDAYKKAASSEICARLRTLQKEREEEVRTSSGTSLVIFKMAQVEAEFGQAKYVTKRLATRKEAEVMRAKDRGRADGSKVSLDTQVEGPAAKDEKGRKVPQVETERTWDVYLDGEHIGEVEATTEEMALRAGRTKYRAKVPDFGISVKLRELVKLA